MKFRLRTGDCPIESLREVATFLPEARRPFFSALLYLFMLDSMIPRYKTGFDPA